ncbi:hypothetical protein FZEAL_5884 [Fusarium zealandicum]|uniref:Secreted protein n=1 Tax=Fusarium zealandicum TaxID=1053134 RepID=A0A8H4XK14_9HYPO|nr:hypothetical protein FZEAL_5884 [Fusarium zealandicum]
MQSKFITAAALLSAVASVQGKPMHKRDVLTALPQGANAIELKFQPALDFDNDGCYNTAAISPNGNVNPGLAATSSPQGDCRNPAQLDNSNAYSRRRCNNGFCAIMHDWENIVVFTKGDTVVRVAPSCHGDYNGASNQFPLSGSNPMLVYHKDGAGTHCFRFANDGDRANPENPTGAFVRSPLVGWDNWPNVGLRDKMLSNWSGGVGPKLDTEFSNSLRAAAGNGVQGFDPSVDG